MSEKYKKTLKVDGFLCDINVFGPQGQIGCVIYHDTYVSSYITFQPRISGMYTVTYTVIGDIPRTVFIEM